MSLNVAALVVVIVFYVVIVIVGVVAAWKFKAKDSASPSEHSMVAGRNLGLGLAIVTCAGRTLVELSFLLLDLSLDRFALLPYLYITEPM